MVRRGLIALVWLGFSSIFAVALAASAAPQLYVFGAELCSYCQKALIFLRGLRPINNCFQLHEFDIVRSSEEATLYARLVTSIGLSTPVVPMIVIGREVILGYESDETTGREIAGHIEACQTSDCPDLVGRMIEHPAATDVVSPGTWTTHRRWMPNPLEAIMRRPLFG